MPPLTSRWLSECSGFSNFEGSDPKEPGRSSNVGDLSGHVARKNRVYLLPARSQRSALF